jgi:hypothetical protein
MGSRAHGYLVPRSNLLNHKDLTRLKVKVTCVKMGGETQIFASGLVKWGEFAGLAVSGRFHASIQEVDDSIPV